ncbi:hypothetical protein [Xylanivirga thermophila]|nr:hypothetical protein [Xylanivirga thermophila]
MQNQILNICKLENFLDTYQLDFKNTYNEVLQKSSINNQDKWDIEI